ncbi:DUF4276 family protein, partial [Bacteroides acidifaciens]|uniref:DUF4276 family protein n=1 Tax=Bacteroides acidifaciens TaxID=85831 RepID=UPI0023C72B99
APYLRHHGIYEVTTIQIHTSKSGRGGFVNYQHLKNDAKRLLSSPKKDFVVSMFVDFFRCPEVPQKERWSGKTSHLDQVAEMEKCIHEDINDTRFISYIQLHEFEALLFASNDGFTTFFSEEQAKKTQQIIESYDNPEDINTTPSGAPSKRLLAIKDDYDKIIEGNLIALEVGFPKIMEKCPRFKAWIEKLIESCKDE